MKKINFSQHVLPHLIAVLAFLVITVAFFNPVFFDNKNLNQSDIIQWEASAQELIEHREATGKEGLWTNSIFGGMPAYLISVKWGNQLIKYTHAVYSVGLPHPVRIIFASMLSFYIMLLCFRVKPYLALIGSVAFGLSSYNIIGLTAGHNARISAVSFMPLVMGGIHLCFNRNKWLGASLTALALAMQLRVNHLQITYYLAFIIGIYGLIQLIYAYREGQLRLYVQRLSLLIVAAVMAIGTFFGEFYATYEYGKYSNRGKSELSQQVDEEMNADGLSPTYAFQYSNGIWDPFTLFIPNALGGNAPLSTDSETADFLRANGVNNLQLGQFLNYDPRFRAYWGSESPTTYYAGAIMVFLFVLGCFLVERKYVVWLVSVAILGILLSYGRNLGWFNNFMFEYFPGYNKFRSVTFTMVMPIFSIGLLGMMALQKLVELKWDKTLQKKLWIALGSTAGLALLLGLSTGMFSFRGTYDSQLPQELARALKNDRKDLFSADAWRAFFFIGIFALTFYLYKVGKLKKGLATLLLVVIGSSEILIVSARFIGKDNYSTNFRSNVFAETPADRYIKQTKKNGDRVIDLSAQFYSARAAYHHHLVNGYHGARIRRYQELIDNVILPEYSLVAQALNAGSIPDFSQTPVLNMLNTRFFITDPQAAGDVIQNPNALGAAWFVKELNYVEDADGEFNATRNLTTPAITAIVNAGEVPQRLSTSANGTINLVEYKPGYWKYESSNTSAGFAVFSEVHYPKGFRVTIDGKEVDMLRANYILRALAIPAGDHTIEFSFEPKIYSVGSTVMQVMSLMVLLAFAGSVYFSLREN